MDDSRFADLATALQAQYATSPQLVNDDPAFLPDREAILAVLERLRRLLFPGCFPRREPGRIPSLPTRARIEADLDWIHTQLGRQIGLALCHRGRAGLSEEAREARCDDCEAQSDTGLALAAQFLDELPAVRELLATDAEAAYHGDPAARSYAEIILAYPGFFAITVYRLAHVLQRLDVPLIPRILSEHAHAQTGVDIHPGAQIGPHFFIDHGTGVVIGETSVIGAHVKIYQGVTLGALSTRGGQDLRGVRRHPRIEDRVTIYGNATILGGDTVIGHDVTVGGNVFITSSIASQTKVTLRDPNISLRGNGAKRDSGTQG